MLGIISIITFFSLFIGLQILLFLIIIGSNDKSEEEQKLEDEEQMKYLRNYNKNMKFGR